MKVQALVEAMERIAPLCHAESWDNVGLLVGDAEAELRGRVMLTIDLTEGVMDEAEREGCGAVVAYHPPIFEAIRTVNASTARQRVLLRAAARGMAVYSPHTALDATPGGVTDWLADGVFAPGAASMGDRRALTPTVELEGTQELKVVTFVPRASVGLVRDALASAGAGLIGGYDLCSFGATGTGSFRGGEGTNPRVGSRGQLEEVEEVRLEMVCAKRALALVVEMLRRFHPYEEPAIDVYELKGKPRRSVGAGRRLVMDQPATLGEVADRLKRHIGVKGVKIAWSETLRGGAEAEMEKAAVSVVGVCPGSGRALAKEALEDGCELYVTGEMDHHDVMRMMERGMSVMLAGHTASERGYLPRLAERLEEEAAGVRAVVSKADRNPFVIR